MPSGAKAGAKSTRQSVKKAPVPEIPNGEYITEFSVIQPNAQAPRSAELLRELLSVFAQPT